MNSALSYFCQFGESSDIKLRNIAALLHQLIREPCFTQLRTKEQLGYVQIPPTGPFFCPSDLARSPPLSPKQTFGYQAPIQNTSTDPGHAPLLLPVPYRYVVIVATWSVAYSTHGLGIRVQSTRAPWYCEARVDAFLEAFAARLAALSDAEFATHKDGLVVKKLERAKNLGEETTRFWDRIRAGHCDFLRREYILLLVLHSRSVPSTHPHGSVLGAPPYRGGLYWL